MVAAVVSSKLLCYTLGFVGCTQIHPNSRGLGGIEVWIGVNLCAAKQAQSSFVSFTHLLFSHSADMEVGMQLWVFRLTANVSCCRSSDFTLTTADPIS